MVAVDRLNVIINICSFDWIIYGRNYFMTYFQFDVYNGFLREPVPNKSWNMTSWLSVACHSLQQNFMTLEGLILCCGEVRLSTIYTLWELASVFNFLSLLFYFRFVCLIVVTLSKTGVPFNMCINGCSYLCIVHWLDSQFICQSVKVSLFKVFCSI